MAAASNYTRRVVSQLGRLLERLLVPGQLLPSLSIQCAVQCKRGAQFSKATGMLINQIAGGCFLGPKAGGTAKPSSSILSLGEWSLDFSYPPKWTGL